MTALKPLKFWEFQKEFLFPRWWPYLWGRLWVKYKKGAQKGLKDFLDQKKEVEGEGGETD
jgi:hypothetical protein